MWTTGFPPGCGTTALDGVGQAPQEQRAFLDHQLPLEQQLPEALYRQVLCPCGEGTRNEPASGPGPGRAEQGRPPKVRMACAKSGLASRFTNTRASAFITAATGSIRSVSSLCFLDSLMMAGFEWGSAGHEL